MILSVQKADIGGTHIHVPATADPEENIENSLTIRYFVGAFPKDEAMLVAIKAHKASLDIRVAVDNNCNLP
jgi:hypothetical protein